MERLEQWLVWVQGSQRYGLPISKVERVLQMVEVRPVPDSSPKFPGIINLEGRVIPVFRLETKGIEMDEVRSSQQLIVTHFRGKAVALVSDEVMGLVDGKGEQVESLDLSVLGGKQVNSVLKQPEGLVLAPELESLLGDLRGWMH